MTNKQHCTKICIYFFWNYSHYNNFFLNRQTPEYKKSLKNSKIFGSEKVDRMFHIVLEIEDKLITKHCNKLKQFTNINLVF